MADWEIFRLDRDRLRVAQLDRIDTARVIPRFNSVGGWTVTIDDSDEGWQSGEGVEFVRDGTSVLSGPVRRLERRYDGDRVKTTASGTDWMVLLRDRVIYPSASPFTAAAYDTRTDVAETLILGYVKSQIGSIAESARRVGSLSFASDQARGTSLTGRGRFHNLLVEMAKVARVGGDLGFRFTLSGGTLTFAVYQPSDLTSTVIFSRELGNLRGWTHVQAAPEVSYGIVGGSGTGTGRTFVEGGSVTPWGRVEEFIDRRASSDTTELGEVLDEVLESRGPTTQLSLEVIDTGSIAYIDDYDLGDKVTVVTDAVTVQDIVREVEITIDRTGETIRPKVRTPGENDPTDPAFFARLHELEARTLNLEID